jgi:nucleoside-diphosphate-sugar epimerase
MRLLLTGATGFVGRNILLREMVENRYDEVWVPVRSLEKLKEQFVGDGFAQIPSKIKPVVGSASQWKLEGAPRFDHVVHSAGTLFAPKRQPYFDVNVEGTLALFRSIQPPDKAIVLSSQAATGPCRNADGVKCEGDTDEPVTWYGQSKLEMEKRLAAEFSHLNYLCLRPPMVLGPRDQATLPLFKMVRRPIFFKAGFKTKFYSYISVFDLVSAIFAALEDKGDWRTLAERYYFISSDSPVTDRELISLAAQASNRKGVFLSVPQSILWGVSRLVDSVPTWRTSLPSLTADRAKEIWPNRWVISSKAFQTRFRWVPREELAQTIRKTREWYVKTGQLV